MRPVSQLRAHPRAEPLRVSRLELVRDQPKHGRGAMLESATVGRLGIGLLVIVRGELSRHEILLPKGFPNHGPGEASINQVFDFMVGAA